MSNSIRIEGARENNLKNITLEIPKNQFIVVTGPSGSGKSTLALDLLQRECQRQYLESSGLSAEAIQKPKVNRMVGLSPSISIGQHVTNRNPRSTVGTVTDLYTYLRQIFTQKGERRCTNCHQAIPPRASGDQDSTVTCPHCNASLSALTKADFSFNTLEGACPTCTGLGTVENIDPTLVFEQTKSLREGAVTFWHNSLIDHYVNSIVNASKHYDLTITGDKPLQDYSEAEWHLLLYGTDSQTFIQHFPSVKPPKTVAKGKFEGIITGMWRRYHEKDGKSSESAFFYSHTCSSCHGERLREEVRHVTIQGRRLPDLSLAPLHELLDWINGVEKIYEEAEEELLYTVTNDFRIRLQRIIQVGLGYLTLDRQAITLSGGESQRLKLASILGSGLTGVLYILDEPTAGLHPKDTTGLIAIMKKLRDLGNTVLVIEHDQLVMHEADHLIDIGPGAGRKGGEIVGQGTAQQLMHIPSSQTGKLLKQKLSLPAKKRDGNGKYVTITNASANNLKNITAKIPLETITSVTGVSGSGKSTLVFDVLAKNKGCEHIDGLNEVDNVIQVGQTPLTRMQRSNVATFMDLFTLLRTQFAAQPKAKELDLKTKNFSFNTAGGRCEQCEGLGQVDVNLSFLSDMKVTCPSCKGQRFQEHVLSVQFKGHSIADFLNLSVEQSLTFFETKSKMNTLLQLLIDVGLGYLNWGQALTTLSGGEGQRLKLAKELSQAKKGHTLYLLDEPTSGLHMTDIKHLYMLLSKLVDANNTVVVVEHHTTIIESSDWVIDLGPFGGHQGGELIASGKPDEIAKHLESVTGKFLFR
ncbi:excinuclease ABC subunit A [Bacillaceae bacterium JMAK1]|nr:excinuclease ABC subunit A [Bacillaceae bacterium JMAK1]